jgi:hypothetical protein
MRSPSYSPPFSQRVNGMVAERPILSVDTDRILAEENLPRPTLLHGSTPEMGFVKEMVHGQCQGHSAPVPTERLSTVQVSLTRQLAQF